MSVMKEVSIEDEWCSEAYIDTDYSIITNEMLKRSAQKYLAFRFYNELLEFEPLKPKGEIIGENELVTLDTIFDIKNDLSSNRVEVEESQENEHFVRYIRPSNTYQGSIAGFVDARTVNNKYIFEEESIYVSTDGQGSHTYSYVSSFEFVPNSNVSVLVPKREMSINEKLYYSLCITINRFRYSYGRKPKGDRLKKLLVPAVPPSFVFDDIFGTILDDWRKIF